MAKETVIPIPFPQLGVDRGTASADQPKGTTFDLLNVRSLHFGDRMGGGKRDGFTKAFSTQLGVQPNVTNDSEGTGQSSESLWRRVNALNLFVALSQGIVIPCEQSELSSGFGQAGTRMLENPEGTLNVVGDMTTIDGTAVAAGNRRFAIWDTETLVWTAPGGFDTARTNTTLPEALLMFDDGSGSLMYCGGGSNASSANQLSRRVASVWTDIDGAGFVGGSNEVFAACAYNGSLYVAGSFTTAGGTTCANIAKWTSEGVFVSVASGVQQTGSVANAKIYALEVYNGKLYAGGRFNQCNGAATTCYNLAAYDGTSWAAVSDGTNLGVGRIGFESSHEVYALRTWNNKLYIGGAFDRLSGGTIYDGHNLVTSWDGTAYAALLFGLCDRGGNSGGQDGVRALEIYDDGTGEALWAFGQINAVSTADGMGKCAPNFASWNGSEWNVAKVGPNNIIRHGIGAGTTTPKHLFMVGSFFRKNVMSVGGIARFDGTDWLQIGGAGATGYQHGTGSLASGSIASGNSALVAGTLANDSTTRLYASINQTGSTKASPGTNATDASGDRYGFGTNAIYAAGIARMVDGGSWERLTDGTVYPTAAIYAMLIWNGRLYFGGAFTANSPISARFSSWDGGSFHTIPNTPTSQAVIALASTDNTTIGPGIFVCSSDQMGGLGANSSYICRWDGSAWNLVGAGANVSGGTTALITCLCTNDAVLYAGGGFTTCKAVVANRVAQWNGTVWAPIGGGAGGGFSDGVVNTLCMYNSELYAGGTIVTTTDGTTVNGISRYDVTSGTWKALGTGMTLTTGTLQVLSMFVYGGFLYIGGRFDTANGIIARCLVKWDGTSFMAADSTEVAGFHSSDSTTTSVGNADVQSMCLFGDDLIVTGQFDYLGGNPSSFIVTSQCV